MQCRANRLRPSQTPTPRWNLVFPVLVPYGQSIEKLPTLLPLGMVRSIKAMDANQTLMEER